MYFQRAIEKSFLKKLQSNKVLVLLGPRRVGKTMFIKHLITEALNEPYIELNGEDIDTQEILKNRTVENYKRLLNTVKLLVIDEAQKIPDIGNILKLMIDSIDGLKIIATGSSVFDLTNKLGEPLTGRKYTFIMFPFAQMELQETENLLQTKSRLEERLIFGSYPELVLLEGNDTKIAYLKEILQSYLLKDILAFEGIRNSNKIISLLQLLAFQIGKEVSLEELGQKLAMSRNTVEKYLDLLSKTFVVYKLPGFSRNLRTEVTKTSRWYFYDNGIRNVLISNVNPLSLRNDVGELWENYLIGERIKFQQYNEMLVNNYFWRTYQQQEIDFIEDKGGKLYAFEIKWNEKKISKIPSGWKEAYPDAEYSVINQSNYLDWIC